MMQYQYHVSVLMVLFASCIYKLVLQSIEREFITHFLHYMNMNLTFSQKNNTKYDSVKIYNLEAFPRF